jgi:tetratricopeptide (TPR) repeat protein
MTRTSSRLRGSLLTRVAVIAAVSLSLASPALAAEKPKAAAAAQYTPAFLALASPLQTQVETARKAGNTAPDVAALVAKVDPLIAAVKTPDDKLGAGGLVVAIGLAAKDTAMQRKGVLLELDSGKAPADMVSKLHVYAAQFAYDAKDYPDVRAQVKAATDAGYKDVQLEVLAADSWFQEKKTPEGLAALKEVVEHARASGVKTEESWYRRGLGASEDTANGDYGTYFATGLITDFGTPANLSLAVAVVRDTHKFNLAETLDVLRVLGRANALQNDREYLDYIEAADPIRNPQEVKDIADKGIAAGKLKATTPFVADALRISTGRLTSDRAALPELDKLAHAATAKTTTIASAADAYLGFGQAPKAAELYKLALGRPDVDKSAVNTRLGIALFDAGDFAGAKAAFSLVEGSRAPIAQLWLTQVAAKAGGK